MAGSNAGQMFNYMKPNVVTDGGTILYSYCSTSSPTFAIVKLFNFSHSSGCIGVFHCGFNLHFANIVKHFFVCLLTILRVPFAPHPSWKLGCLSSCRHSLSILDTRSFLFFNSVFDEQKF